PPIFRLGFGPIGMVAETYFLSDVALFAKRFYVLHQIVKILGGDLVPVEGGHYAKANNPGAHLKFHGEDGERFVVESWAEAAFASRVTGVAMPHEDDFAVLYGGVGRYQWPYDGFA